MSRQANGAEAEEQAQANANAKDAGFLFAQVRSTISNMPTNILFITTDQQHFSLLGVDNPHIKTPALDRLARQGALFRRAYCPNPTCTPTRASLITGQYPSSHGAWSLGTGLDAGALCVGDVFQKAGYDASLIGKAHFLPLGHDTTPGGFGLSVEAQPILRDLKYWREFHGPWYGFNHIELTRNHADESHVGQHYALWMEEKGLKNWRDYFVEPNAAGYGSTPCKEGTWKLPAEYHYTAWTGERTRARLEHCAARQQPFFLWSSYHDPHPPYLVPEPWASMYDPADMPIGKYTPGEMDDMPLAHRMVKDPKADFSIFKETPWGNHGYQHHICDEDRMRKQMAIYYGMMSFIDHEIGKTLDKLDELGLAKDTIVCFTTDHGHFLGHHGLTAKGGFHYEDLIRLPFIARWPGHIAPGTENHAIQSLVDMPTTFLSACGLDVPLRMQGVDQTAVWEGKKDKARDGAFIEFRHQPTVIHLRTYVNARYKLTIYRDSDEGELIDLETDPGELVNHWADPAYKDVKAELMAEMLNAELKREVMPRPRVAGA